MFIIKSIRSNLVQRLPLTGGIQKCLLCSSSNTYNLSSLNPSNIDKLTIDNLANLSCLPVHDALKQPLNEKITVKVNLDEFVVLAFGCCCCC